MCAPWDAGCLANSVAETVSKTVLGQIADAVVTGEQYLIDASASWWVLVPSISFYPNAHNTDPYATPITAVQNLHALILPITAIIAVGGMLWNGLLMVLSRKPAPLTNVLRGLWNTALWSAVGVFGTNLLLAGTDEFSTAVMASALRSVGDPSLGKRLGSLLVPVTGGGLPVGLIMLFGGIGMIGAFIQTLLMMFRDASVLILAGMMPLAASGSFTNATGGWMRKVTTWQLSLIFYKPFVAMSYAAAIWLTGENTSKDPRVLFVGMAMMLVSLIALPVLLKFFSWTVGSLQSGGGGLGMLATAGAAGMHAASSLRGVGGGSSVNEHARYISELFDRGGSGGGGGGGGSTPTGSGSPGPGPIPGGSPIRPPAFTGAASSGASAGGATAGAATGGAAAAGGATSAAMAGSAATGPAAPFVAAGVAAVSTGVQVAKAGANAAASAASDSTKGS
jgi:hypothetical protein